MTRHGVDSAGYHVKHRPVIFSSTMPPISNSSSSSLSRMVKPSLPRWIVNCPNEHLSFYKINGSDEKSDQTTRMGSSANIPVFLGGWEAGLLSAIGRRRFYFANEKTGFTRCDCRQVFQAD